MSKRLKILVKKGVVLALAFSIISATAATRTFSRSVKAIENEVGQEKETEFTNLDNYRININTPETVKLGNAFNIKLSADKVTEDSIYAMEFNIEYDNSKVDFIEATSLNDSKYIVSSKNFSDYVKVIIATKGVPILNLEDFVNVKFNSKATGENIAFNVTNINISDDNGNEFEMQNSSVNVTIEEEQVAIVDKEVLKIFINYAEQVKINGGLENVVPSVVTEFEEALKEAKIILAKENATQEEVNKVMTRLVEVIHMLDFKKGDKTQLIKLVDIISTLDKDKYKPSTWSLLEVQLNEATRVIADENAMEEEVATTYENLIKAYLDLRLIPNKDKLEELINEANKIDESKYTEESINVFKIALARANEILNNKEVNEEEVEKATNDLEESINKLVANADDNDNEETPGDEETPDNDDSTTDTEKPNEDDSKNPATDSSDNTDKKEDNNKNNDLPETGSGLSSIQIAGFAALLVVGGLVIRKRRVRF